MSTQSIIKKSKERYYEEFDKKAQCNANDYYMYKHFRIGHDMNDIEALFYNKLRKLMCTDNCELIDWVKKKLEGKLEECGVKKKSKERTLQDLIRDAQKHTCCSNPTDAVCECIPQWQEIVEW